ncbi:alcohol dehydrogenase catalytic domain-containing protein [Arthrobacter sp. Marseille-P9274]|uniref:alcohol dehydrogenase catalytic domain-containing protein n=1 Tax=Arthrobacter sp. Marseille-P9274 TaxID=2866572 RepID=UPI0021C8D446|nr:alcohol dehydrogenase catalytic domain-containing protein [Arthrobacter sp. Marseille-P9274]
METCQRERVYPVEYPVAPGTEGMGVVAGVGSAVTNFASGDQMMSPSSPPRPAWSAGWPVRLTGTFPLAHAGEAHRLRESRAVQGQPLLVP